MGDKKETVLAICYDFDKTLSPTDMQAQGYIQSVGYDVDEFWEKTNALAQANEMDSNLAYMYVMMDEARGRLLFNREKLEEYGSRVQLFPGVDGWFDRINEYGINYTNKTQFLFRIEKGVLDINDEDVNEYFEPENMRVPFRNMVYIGDSDTDIPCMKLVNINGGHSIGVYNPENQNKDRVHKMLRDNRIRYFAPADYSEGAEIDKLLKAIIDKTAAYEILEDKHVRDKHESYDK